MFGAGFIFHAIGERREWHRKYLDYRALAEGLRVQLFWNLSGVVETQSAVFAYDNFLQKQDVDLGWIRHVMRSASLWRDRTQEPGDDWVPWVIDKWVGSSGEGGQLAYYHRKSLQKAESYQRTTRLGAISLWWSNPRITDPGVPVQIMAFPPVSSRSIRNRLPLRGW